MTHEKTAPATGSADNTPASTPGRPHDTSRQQKHDEQNLDSGSESLDRRSSGGGASEKAPKPAGAK